jgi:hypothetical protein
VLEIERLDHVGVPNTIIDQSVLRSMSTYNWLKRQPMEKQSLHNIRLRFESGGLWNIYSKMNTFVVNPDNKDIILPTNPGNDKIKLLIADSIINNYKAATTMKKFFYP